MMKRKTTRRRASPKKYKVVVETKTESKQMPRSEAIRLKSAMCKKVGRRKGVKVKMV